MKGPVGNGVPLKNSEGDNTVTFAFWEKSLNLEEVLLGSGFERVKTASRETD